MIITACAPYVYDQTTPVKWSRNAPRVVIQWEGGNARGVLMHTELQKYSLIQCVLEYNQISLTQIP